MTERETPHPETRNRESRPLSRLVTVGLALLTLSALYLLGPARMQMGWAAALAVLVHIGIGLLLIVPVAACGVRAKGRSVAGLRSLFWPAFGLCALTGLVLTVRAADGVSAGHHREIWWSHLVAGFLAVFVLGAWLTRSRRGFRLSQERRSVGCASLSSRPGASPQEVAGSNGLKSFARGAARRRPAYAGTLSITQHVVWKCTRGAPRQRPAYKEALQASQILHFRVKDFAGTLPLTKLVLRWHTRWRLLVLLLLSLLGTLGLGGTVLLPHYDAAAYYRDTTATNAAQAENPFFPAGLRLAADSQPTSERADYCGRAGCHANAQREWQGSVHQQAATDPVYQRVREEYAAHSGQTAARWCAGCHEPLSVLKESRPNPMASVSAGAGTKEGVGCTGCHAVTDVSARSGNGRVTLCLPQNYPFADRQTGWPRRLHDFLLNVRPAPHQAAYLKPEIHGGSDLCGTCHRQSFNVPQNGYQFVHGADEWGTWQSGPFSGRTARTAGLQTQPQRSACQDCHFARRADGAFSHASAGSGIWLSSRSGASRWKSNEQRNLLPRSVDIDIFALRRSEGVGRQESWMAPLDAPLVRTPLRPGETCLLDIVVSNRSTGHEFPAGYLDIQEAWLEVTLHDGRGQALAESGKVEGNGAVLPADTHAYRSIPLDRSGNAVQHHELWQQVTTATRRAIPSGGADIARYRLTIPRTFTPPLTVQARLRYRSLRPDFAKWVGLKAGVPIVNLADESVVLPLSAPATQKRSDANVALRFVEYGLGLLAPKDAPDAARARRAFLTAQRLAPNRPEPFLGLGRAYLAEPELLAARAQFDTALRLAPENPAAQADLGVVYGKQGEYDRALSLLRPLALRFPQDSALQFDLGLTLFRSGNYAAAVTAFENSLAADPDNAAAHFQLKQCFQHLQRVPEARREEAIGQYLAEDHLFPLLVPPFLKAHPDVRQAAQPIPEHLLRPHGQPVPGRGF